MVKKTVSDHGNSGAEFGWLLIVFACSNALHLLFASQGSGSLKTVGIGSFGATTHQLWSLETHCGGQNASGSNAK